MNKFLFDVGNALGLGLPRSTAAMQKTVQVKENVNVGALLWKLLRIFVKTTWV